MRSNCPFSPAGAAGLPVPCGSRKMVIDGYGTAFLKVLGDLLTVLEAKEMSWLRCLHSGYSDDISLGFLCSISFRRLLPGGLQLPDCPGSHCSSSSS